MFTKISAGRTRSTYEFIKANSEAFGVQVMCRLLGVAPSGYYAWLKKPVSSRAQEDTRLLRLIRASFTAGQGIYGAPRVFLDLREAGETCSKHRVARLMRESHLRARHGYRTRGWSVGKPSTVIPNLLKRQFTVTGSPRNPGNSKRTNSQANPLPVRMTRKPRQVERRPSAAIAACSPADLDLVEGCKRRDPRSWDVLYRRYRWLVYRWAVRFKIPKSERPDICQETFLSAFRNLAGFRGQSHLATWMFAIAARRAKAEWRRGQDWARLSSLLVSDSAPEAERDLSEQGDRMRVLTELLNKLTAKKRSVLVMFELDERPMSDVARALHCPERTAWARLHHARAELITLATKRGLRARRWWRGRTEPKTA